MKMKKNITKIEKNCQGCGVKDENFKIKFKKKV